MKTSGKPYKKILKLLYRSFDTVLNEKKQQRLDEALEQFQDLKEEKENILSRREAATDNAERAFKPYFADRVMAHIAAIGDKKDTQESFYDALMLGFKRLAVAGGLVMIVLLFFNVFQGYVIPTDEAFFASDLILEEILSLPIF